MKTYIFDTLNRYKRLSQRLDIESLLCGKTWTMFNDEGKSIKYFFDNDMELHFFIDGIGKKGSWKYFPSSNSLTLDDYNGNSTLLNVAYSDTSILVLNVDGTNTYTFLTDNTQDFSPNKLADVNHYFEKKLEMQLKAEEEERRIEEERRKREEEERKKLAEKDPVLEGLKKTGICILIVIICCFLSFYGFDIILKLLEMFNISLGLSHRMQILIPGIITFGASVFIIDDLMSDNWRDKYF